MSAWRGLAAGLLAAFVAGGAWAQERPAGFALGSGGTRVAIALEGADGVPPRSGRDLRVAIAFTDEAGGKPVPGLTARAWLRRTLPEGGPRCAGAAWTVRATGAISPDDVALDRAFLVAIGRDGGTGADRLAVIDLSHQLRSANQVSVTPLGGRATALLVHPRTPRAFVLLEGTGAVASVALPWGGRSDFATGFDAPEAVLPLGPDLVVLDGGETPRLTRLSAEGARLETLAAGPSPVRLLSAGADGIVAVAGDGSARILRAERRPVVNLLPGSLGDPIAASNDVLVSVAADGDLRIRWLDDPHAETRLALPFRPDGLFLREDGRFGLAWADRRREAVALDLGRSRVRDAIPLTDAVEDAASSGTAIVLTHAREPVATVIDLAPLGSGTAPAVRRVHLPVRPPGTALGASERGARLVGGRGGAVTVRPGSDLALTIAAGGGLGGQPVPSVTIRGDRPSRIARFDQRLTEVEPGRFEGAVRLASGGLYEVVTTTGPGGTTACAAFTVSGPDPDTERTPRLRLISGPTDAAIPGTLTLALADAPPGLAAGPITLRVQDLAFGDTIRLPATLAADARLSAPVRFSSAGAYAISVEAVGARIPPVVIRIGP